MKLATPQALAELLQRDKEELIAAWEKRAKQIPGVEELPSAYLHDHLPLLLDELAEQLRAPGTSGQRLREFSAAHGEHRQQIGLRVSQVVEEYKILRRCISEHTELAGLAPEPESNRIVNALIDDGVKTSIDAYIARRDAAERARREEYLRFVVHDLRSPLTAIYYAILLAEKELQDAAVSERVRSIHAAIKRNIERMRALIVKLLQEEDNIRMPHQVAVEREPVDLWPVVESAVRTLSSMAASSDTRVINHVPRELSLHADPALLERIFQNLLSNAIEHTHRGEVTVGGTVSGDRVECWVADNGRGIPEELRKRVFDKFTTDTERRTGVGLGLAVVKQLIEAHGGSLELRSEVGQGTTVRFTLPIVLPAPGSR